VDISLYIAAFFADLRVQAFLWLIAVHLLLRIAASIKAGVFRWKELAAFYRESIVPYTIGALALYLAAKNIPPAVLGSYADIVGEAAFTIAWLFLIATIIADIISAMKALGYPIPGRPEAPEPPSRE
jgi:hypothetical protein